MPNANTQGKTNTNANTQRKANANSGRRSQASIPQGVENAMWGYLDANNAAKLAAVNKDMRNTTRRMAEEQGNAGKAIRNARNTVMSARLKGAPAFVNHLYSMFQKHSVVVELGTTTLDIDDSKQSLKYRISNTPGMSCTCSVTRAFGPGALGGPPYEFPLTFAKLKAHMAKWQSPDYSVGVRVYIDANTDHAFELWADSTFEGFKIGLANFELSEPISVLAEFEREYTDYANDVAAASNAANATNARSKFPSVSNLARLLTAMQEFFAANA